MAQLTFHDGIWYAVQYLVVTEDQPTMARDLALSACITKETARKLQKLSGSYADKMDKFIKEEL